MNIRKRFIIFSILWGIIPVIISTIMCISNFNAKNVEMIKKNVAALSNDQAMHLNAFFDQNVRDLNFTSNIPIIKNLLDNSNNGKLEKGFNENVKLLDEIFRNRRNEQFFLDSEFLIDKNGVIIVSCDNEYTNKKVILSHEEIKELSNDNVVVTNIIQREDFNNGVKSVIIANPIFYKNRYQGAVANVINMNYFEKLVNEVHFFETGKIAVMDKNGIIAASSSKDANESIGKINAPSDLDEKWQNIDFNKDPKGIIEYKIRGVEKIGYYSTIGNSGWIVLSGIEWNELITPINKSIKNITIFVVFIVLLIIASYTFIINYFSRPIYKLLGVIRKIKQGDYRDRFIYNEDNEFGEIATAFNDLIDNIERNKKHIEEKNKNLQSLTSNIPGGVYRCRIEGEKYFFDFVSSGYLNLLGYRRNEFKEISGQNLFHFIHDEDIERITHEIKEQLSNDKKYSVEYRVKRKDGKSIWLLDNGRIVKNRDGKFSIYSVVIDVTKSKKIQKELRISEERYGIIMSQTEDIIFEWNIKKDTVYFSENWKKKFNYTPITTNISKNILKTNNIYNGDIKDLGKLLNDIVNGANYKETEIRIRKNAREYIWCKIRMSAMFDESGSIFKAIGVIIDIDKEKKEAEKLLYKAQRDSLTSLYNKGTTQSLIEDYIENKGKETKGALFVIDLDNFKAVNDNLGHLAGDNVLTSTSEMISKIFSENSIVGRIGGDEFIIYLMDIESDEFINKKAEELLKGFRTNSTKEISDYNVSGSIGIAKFPEHGESYKELFACADKAAYLAKNRGRNNYCIFNDI